MTGWRRLRAGIGAGVIFALGVAATFVIERYNANQAYEAQREAAAEEIELLTDRLTRDLTQEVAIVQGLTALASAEPNISEEAFKSYTRNFRRTFPTLRRVYLIRDGKVIMSDRPASTAASFPRVEERLAPNLPMTIQAVQRGSSVMSELFTTSEGDDVFVFARPVFLEDGQPGAQRLWGFAGINIDKEAILCRLTLCETHLKYRAALRIVVDRIAQPPFFGEASLFEPSARAVRHTAQIPGVRIEVVAVPAEGWIEASPHRWLILGGGILAAIAAAACTFLLFSGTTPGAFRARFWVVTAALCVFLLVSGVATFIDRLLVERGEADSREAIVNELAEAADHGTLDLSDDAAVLQNLATFVEANPNFTDATFRAYAQKLRQQHPRIAALHLAKDAKISHADPAAHAEFGVIGLDLRRNAAEAALVNQSIAKGTPLLLGPFRLGPGAEVFSLRRPIYTGDGTPSAERFWGFAGVVIRRNEVVCMFTVCEEPGKYRYAMRIVTEGQPLPAFVGDEKLFSAGSEAITVAIRIPGSRFEMAAIPAQGWSADANRRWLLWLLAVPLGLVAGAGALIALLRRPAPVVQVWLGVLTTLGGILLLVLREEVAATLRLLGVADSADVRPAIMAFTVFAIAYTINAALVAFVWPAQTDERDSLHRAPAVLRSMVSLLLFGTAALWAATFIFKLDLTAVGFTSGALGLVLGFATKGILEDFFSGVMIGLEQPYALGDWIEVQGVGKDVGGLVSDMTWRATSISNRNSDTIIVPNSSISRAVVINRSRPYDWTEISVPLSLPSSLSLEEVERRVTAAILQLGQKTEGIATQRAPVIYVTESKADRVLYDIQLSVVLSRTSEPMIRGKILTALHNEFAGLPKNAAPAATSEAKT